MGEIKSPLPASGRGRIFHDGAVHEATWNHAAWLSDYEVLVTLADGRSLPVSDADERMGYIYLAPDSGTQMTNIMVLLAEGEADPVAIPDKQTVAGTAFPAMQPVYESVSAGNTDPDDLDFCRQIFTSPEAMLRTIQREGSLDAARRAILRDVFRL